MYESRLSLTVDSRTGEQSLKRFRGELEKTERSGEGTSKSVGRIRISLAAMASAARLASGVMVGVGAGLTLMSKQASDAAAQIVNLSNLANASAEQFQRMTFAAAEYGIGQEKLADILKDVNDRVGDFMATGGGPMADFFEQIAPRVGVTAEQFRNLSGPQALQLYYDSLERANLSQADMTFYLEAMASDATALIPALRDSGAEIKRLGDEADNLNAILSNMELQRLRDLRGEFAQLEQQLSTETMRAVSQFDEIVKSSLEGISFGVNRVARGFNIFMDSFRDEENKRSIAGINSELQAVFDNRDRLQRDIDIFGKDSERGRNAAAAMAELRDRYNELIDRKKELMEQGPAVDEPEVVTLDRVSTATAAAADEARRLAEAWNDSRQSSYDALHGLLDEIDPVGAELRQLAADTAIVQEAFARGFITAEQADEIINRLNDPKQWEDAGKESAEAFINPWQSAADSVAQSLQDAIASGDWDSIGDAIGGALGSSIAAIVNKQVTDSLAKSITADSGMFAQIGAAFAGPIAGAVVGGAIQLAVSELSDYFSDDWDPTEARQAAQGTRTILGDMDAKSESIRRAVEGSESGIGQLVGINQNMLQALRSVQTGITGASARVARGASGVDIASPSVMTGGEALSLGLGGGFEFAADMYLDYLSYIFTAGIVDFGKLLGGKAKKRDEGIRIIGGYIGDLIDDTMVQAYATFRVKKHAFDDYDTKERYENLDSDVGRQFSLVFASIYDSVGAGLDAFGLDIDRLAQGFTVSTQKISLEGLSASQQQAELEAYFGTVFDKLAGYTVPWLDEFQQAGEGLGETLARVANQTMVTQEAVNRLGIQFSDLAGRELVVASERLMDAAGGVEQFITSMQGFIGNFASDAQKFELAYSDITRALEQSNLALPSTRDGYYDLLQAQNGATAAGAENIATLLRLQGVADQYYTALEDSQMRLLKIQRDVVSESLREAERASDSVSRALAGLTIQSSSFARLSRDAALASLQGMAASGRIGDQGQLDRALSAATNIQAGEFSTMNDYIRGVSRTGETLRDLKWVADQQLTREQRSLANIERQMEAMNEEVSAVGRATAKHTAKTAKLLERIEVEGLEVRA